MTAQTIKIGANAARHLQKYEGSTEADYIKHSKRTARKVTISRHDTAICEKFNLYTIAHLVHVHDELPDGIDLRDMDAIVEATINPYELAKMWIHVRSEAENFFSKETVINQHFDCIRKTCFERWGDKNWLTDVSKKWFDDDAIELDVKIDSISQESGLEIEVDDVIEFVRQFKPGEYQNPMQLLQSRIEEKFKENCGFNIKSYYADHLVKCCEFVQSEPIETVCF